MTASDDTWIAVDWGTTRLRAWTLAGTAVRRARSSEAGMNTLAPDGFEPALRALIGEDLVPGRSVPVLCCGMVGARQGWIEAPYREVPCAPTAAMSLVAAPCAAPGLDVHLVPGLAQRRPADVMRGEETQVAGFLAGRPDFAGLLCLPGTHTKWVRVHDGRVERFASVMSGELFALISTASVLRHGIAADGWDATAFDAAFRDALAAPAAVTRRLFSLRAAGLLDGLDAVRARSRLSGLLLGIELVGLAEPDEPADPPGRDGVPRGDGTPGSDHARETGGTHGTFPEAGGASAGPTGRDTPFADGAVVVIGAPELAERYARAIRTSGREAELVDGERLTLAGLIALHRTGTVGERP